jgi:hypothetical protein
LLLSLEFGIPGQTPEIVIPCGARSLFGWRIPSAG